MSCIKLFVWPSQMGECFFGRVSSHHIQKFLAKYIWCLKIHPQAVLYRGFEIRSLWNFTIERSVTGVGALLDGRQGILIEDGVCLAQNVSIYTLQHDVNDPEFGITDKGGTVVIKSHVWINSKTTVLPKYVLEEGSVLASGAILT